ncbi:MAG: ABC transporter ATP-binding protein [Bacteriovoracales bacterium]|nr:ABC transporter ATP-binding protein [Bacteriovoracales bacterium]
MKKIYDLLFPHLRPHFMLIFASFILSLFFAGSKALYAYLIKPIIDNGLSPESTLSEVLFLVGTIVAVGLINIPIRFFHFYWMRYVIEKTTCEIRSRIYRKFQSLPLKHFQKNKQGELLSSLLNDALVLSNGLMGGVGLIREPLTALVLFSLALYRDWRLTLVMLAVTPLFLIVFRKSGNRVRASQGSAQKSIAEMAHNVSETLLGQKVIKAFNLQDYSKKRFEKSQSLFLRFILKTIRTEEAAKPIIEFLGSLAFGTIILLAYHRISYGTMSPGDFISTIVALIMFLDPVRKYTPLNVSFNQARAAGERILHLLSLEEERDLGTLEKKTFENKIEFKNITFSYGEANVLENVSMEIKKGERVGLVGLSGSGKSTLINLFLRLYEVQKGTITIDGVSTEKLSLNSLRSLFGFVSQDVFLFNDTVLENVVLDQKFDETQIQKALKVSHATDFIEGLPEKLETIIGDRGARLSGGQAQRLTVARAYLRQSPILLFDEATSALDNESEKIVQKALDEFSDGHTVIAVAHRLSTIQHFDRIIVLKDGAIVEQGTHGELIERGGEYKKLYELSK